MVRTDWTAWHLDSAGCRVHLQLRPGRAEAWRAGLVQLPSPALTPCACGRTPSIITDTALAASPLEATEALSGNAPAMLRITRDHHWGEVRRLLNGVLHCVQLAAGRLTLHAAAVGQRERALLLLGGHGAGKTLTSLHLARRGWPILAGDVAVVSVADGPPTLVGGTQAVLARPAGLARHLPEAAGLAQEQRQLTPGEPRVDVSALVPVEDPGDGAPRPLLGLAVLQPGGGVLDRRQPRPAPARRLRGTLSRSSAYQLDREVDPLDLPLRLMEAPRQLRRRLELCRALCAALPTVELMADPGAMAEALRHEAATGGFGALWDAGCHADAEIRVPRGA